MFHKFENMERSTPSKLKISGTLNQGGVLKNHVKVPYNLGKSVFIYLITPSVSK